MDIGFFLLCSILALASSLQETYQLCHLKKGIQLSLEMTILWSLKMKILYMPCGIKIKLISTSNRKAKSKIVAYSGRSGVGRWDVVVGVGCRSWAVCCSCYKGERDKETNNKRGVRG